MQTPFANPHAQAVAAMLRHTVYNPAAPTIPIAYHCWHRINSILWSKSICIHESEVSQLTQDFCELIVSITESTGMQITPDDLSWLLGVICDRDATILSLLLAMSTMQPTGDTISTSEAAEIVGHADNTVVRKWCADGRFLSARKLDGRTWTVARSEIMLHRRD